MRPALIAVVLASLAAAPAFAQTQPGATPGAAGTTMPNMPTAAASSATTPWAQANADAMQSMQQAMMNASGGASTEDEAFVRGMLPHHQGAIDMARVELQFGHDPELKRLAARIVATQQMEIREMSAWLARHH